MKNAAGGAGTTVELEERDPTQVLTHEVPPFMLKDEPRSCKEKGRTFHLQQKGGSCEWHRVFAEDTWQGLQSLTAHFMAGSAGSLTTFLLTALKHRHSQLHLPETPPLQPGHSCSVRNRLPRKSEGKLFNFWVGFLLD